MCELIICVVDKASSDLVLDCALDKRGGVVDVMEDGHAWGTMELTHPMFRIVKLPGVPASFGQAFMGGEPGDGTANPYLLRRQFKIDLDNAAIPAAAKAWLADDTRAQPSMSLPQALLTTLKAKRPSAPHPNVIGQAANVIG